MGWFIAQSLAFIIVAALIGLGTGVWTGWLVWGRRAKGRHTAEKAEAAARATTAASASGADKQATAEADASDGTGTTDGTEQAGAEKADAEPVPALVTAAADIGATETTGAEAAVSGSGALPVAGSASGPGTADEPYTADTEADTGHGTATGDDAAEVEAAVVAQAESAVVAEAEAVARRAAEADAAAETPDDLQRIEGVGPKIASALAAAGYLTFARIAAATEEELREAVASQGIRFAPSAGTWAGQAQYLVDSDTEGLDEYQDYLVGGQERRAKFNEEVDYADVDRIEGAEAKAAALAEDEAEAAAAEATPEPEPARVPGPERQDLRRIEGIGPKIEAVLGAAGYTTYAQVAAASETELREALAAGGITFAPAAASWAEQAKLLTDGEEEALHEYQDYLVGGQERRSEFRADVDYTDVDGIEGAGAKAAALADDEARAAAAGGQAGSAGPGVTA